VVAALLALAGLTAGCGNAGGTDPPSAPTGPAVTTTDGSAADQSVPDRTGTDPATPLGVERLVYEVVAVHPHDPDAFTQGLLVSDDGRLFESTGLYGSSSIREVELASGAVIRRADLPPELFGEGLALVGEVLVQLTWREGVALRWDADTLDPVGTLRYEGEGWGLCWDGGRLVMSDGSDRLTFREPDGFEVIGYVEVELDGSPLERLNELECVDGEVWANVWQTDTVVRIDPATGRVNGVLDAGGLLDRGGAPEADVLNGIAALPGTDRFLLTGKRWPSVFEVRIVPAT
jgi:glutaminyl-peptide cyclotransferase